MNLKRFLSLLLSLLSLSLFSQSINWMSLNEALEKNKTEPRKIIIDAYTDWCGWCKKMDATTFQDPTVAQLINTHFYAVKFNAETTDTIKYLGKEYVNTAMNNALAQGKPIRRATHDIASVFMGRRISYPTIVVLNEESKLIAPIPGYRKTDEMQAMLIYFAEDLQKTVSLQDFMNDFKTTFYSQSLDAPTVNWMDINNKFSQKKPEKKTLVFFYTDWCNTCKMMEKVTFADSTLIAYAEENIDIVKFNATEKKEVKFNGGTFKNDTTKHPFHDFAASLLNGQMQFPAMVFFNENNQPISPLKGYYEAKGLMPIMKFFTEDFYKTQKWEEFIAEYNKK